VSPGTATTGTRATAGTRPGAASAGTRATARPGAGTTGTVAIGEEVG
jgi:hypothetical protein